MPCCLLPVHFGSKYCGWKLASAASVLQRRMKQQLSPLLSNAKCALIHSLWFIHCWISQIKPVWMDLNAECKWMETLTHYSSGNVKHTWFVSNEPSQSQAWRERAFNCWNLETCEIMSRPPGLYESGGQGVRKSKICLIYGQRRNYLSAQ